MNKKLVSILSCLGLLILTGCENNQLKPAHTNSLTINSVIKQKKAPKYLAAEKSTISFNELMKKLNI